MRRRWLLTGAATALALGLLAGTSWRTDAPAAASTIPAARLLDAMGDPRGPGGIRARALLVKRGASVAPDLIERLKHPAPATRAAAALVLGAIRDPRAVRPLCAVLVDTDPRVRYRAAYALGRLKNPDAVPHLAPLLRDPDPDVRQVTVRALEECRCKVRLRASSPGYEILPAGETTWRAVGA